MLESVTYLPTVVKETRETWTPGTLTCTARHGPKHWRSLWTPTTGLSILRQAQEAAAPAVYLRVVHGYGSTGNGGVLRTRFRKFFEKHESRMEFTPGEKVSVNPGYTLVTPRYPLPGTDAVLSELVWDYCEQAKPMGRIVGQFRRYGTPRVQQAVRTLEGQKRLRKVMKGKSSAYQAV